MANPYVTPGESGVAELTAVCGSRLCRRCRRCRRWGSLLHRFVGFSPL